MKEKKTTQTNRAVKNITAAGVCLALSLLLPFLTGNILQISSAISPMHIPVLLCGFICGPFYGAVVGAIAPLLRSMLFGMPPIMPIGAAMCFELAVYGAVSGLLYIIFPKKTAFIYVSLVAAMLCGRIVWGIASVCIAGLTDAAFSWQAFISGAFINAIPGIILHIVLVPAVVIALKKARFME